MRKFQCPRCGKGNIKQTTTGGIRKSEVLKVDPIDSEKFLCCSPQFYFIDPASQSHYNCSSCNRYLGTNVKDILANYFIEDSPKHPFKTHPFEVNDSAATPEDLPKNPAEGGNRRSAQISPKFDKNSPDDLGQFNTHDQGCDLSPPATKKYTLKPLKKCSGDSPSVRETIDMINFVIADLGDKVEVYNDGSTRTHILSKIIHERPYLFERIY